MEHYKDGSFVIFNHNHEIKQISHTDNGVLWFTDDSFMYPMDKHLIKPITLKEISLFIGKMVRVKNMCSEAVLIDTKIDTNKTLLKPWLEEQRARIRSKDGGNFTRMYNALHQLDETYTYIEDVSRSELGKCRNIGEGALLEFDKLLVELKSKNKK